MIDIQNIVLTNIETALSGENVTLSGAYVRIPSSFPFISVMEEDNATYVPTFVDNVEHHADLIYEVNVYTNNKQGARQEARRLMNLVDNAMAGMKFIRTFCQPVPNEDIAIYRLTARYQVTVSKGVATESGTEYFMYQT